MLRAGVAVRGPRHIGGNHRTNQTNRSAANIYGNNQLIELIDKIDSITSHQAKIQLID